jgi:hypothetical protein
VIIALVNVEGDPGEYTGVIFARGPIKKSKVMYVHGIGLECVNMITYVLVSQ